MCAVSGEQWISSAFFNAASEHDIFLIIIFWLDLESRPVLATDIKNTYDKFDFWH